MCRTLWISLAALVFLAGCATSLRAPAYFPDEAKAQLGTVGIASARFIPEVEFRTPAKGVLSGAGRRAARWAGKAAGFVGRASPSSAGCSGYACGGVVLLWLGTLVGATVGGALAGGVVGAMDALPAETVREAEVALTTSLSELKPQEKLRDRVFQVARQKTPHPILVLAEFGPSSPDEHATYGSPTTQGVDSILEISMLTIGLEGDWDVNPPLALAITGRTRLVRVQDGSEVHATKLEYRSGMRIFTEWAANEAQLFREEIDRALDCLAEEIVETHFLLLPTLTPSSPSKPAPAGEVPLLPTTPLSYTLGQEWIRNDGEYRLTKIDKDLYVFSVGPDQEIHLTKNLMVAQAKKGGWVTMGYFGAAPRWHSPGCCGRSPRTTITVGSRPSSRRARRTSTRSSP